MTQTSYVGKLLMRFNLVDSKIKAVPLTGGENLKRMGSEMQSENDAKVFP